MYEKEELKKKKRLKNIKNINKKNVDIKPKSKENNHVNIPKIENSLNLFFFVILNLISYLLSVN